MSIEAAIHAVLAPLVGNRVFPDVAPVTTPKPYVTYIQIGGEIVEYLGRETPSIQNGRFQVNVWGTTRLESSRVMLQIEAALIAATTFQARPLSAPTSTYDHDMILYGSMQDFGIWSNRT
jgi:hypothetical protein